MARSRAVIHWQARHVHAVVMFWPAASPVSYTKRKCSWLPIWIGSSSTSRVQSETVRTSRRMESKWSVTQRANCEAEPTSPKMNTGARVMRWCTTRVVTPPARVIAVAPRVADATSDPSVVANGALTSPVTSSPSNQSGPASPTGTSTPERRFSTFPARLDASSVVSRIADVSAPVWRVIHARRSRRASSV